MVMLSEVDERSHSEPRQKRRRRPALSCFECRRRKIKCDRTVPCGQCVQSRHPRCNFSPDAPPPSAAVHGARTAAPVTEPGNVGPARSGETLLSVPPSYPFNQDFPTPASSPRTVTSSEVHRSIKPPSKDSSSPAHGDPNGRQPVLGMPSDVYVQGATRDLRAILSKSRLHGPSHYKSSFEQFEEIGAFVNNHDWKSTSSSSADAGTSVSDLHVLVNRCKDLARKAKVQQRPGQWCLPDGLRESVPDREVADELTGLYFRNFESAYRILHVPSFQDDYERYWTNPKVVDDGFLMTVLLIMAIGTCFYQGPAYETSDLRSKASEWIYAAHSWLSAPLQKARLNMKFLQVHCLLLLARQTNSAGPDLVWIPAGSLLRTAIHMGLHRDPTNYPKMPVFHAEIRRRLWATILEMTVQFSLDCGMPPMISLDDFDTMAPRNIDDDEISESVLSPPPPSKSDLTFTQTSMQISLFRSLRTRLGVAQLINHFRSEPSYEDVLRLSSELFDVIRESAVLVRTYRSSELGHMPSGFQCNLVEHLLRRFLLALHRPFGIKARRDPRFYFSRKVCLEQALIISSPQVDKDFSRLIVVGGGMFKEIMTHGALTLCLELITQLEEDDRNMTLELNRAGREPMHEAVRRIVTLSEERLRTGDTNVKGHLFLSIALGQIESMEAGTRPEEGMFSAAKKAAMTGYKILTSRILPPDTNAASHPDEPYIRQEPDGEATATGITQDLNMKSLPDVDFDFDFDDAASWLFPTFDEIPWSSIG